jgi:hypothetical protein
MLRLSMRGDSARREYLALLAEEYRTLATSGNQADRHTYTALQWGTAIVGIVASGAISQWGKHDAAVELTFLVAIPALVAVGMLYWVGELARMRRIYDFMCAIEAKAELALRDPTHSTSRRGWFRSFDKRWTAERTTLLADLKLAMPHSDQGTVEIASGPIGFERWLRMIRNTQASSNLSWVFAVRFILFPSSLAASWLTGIYYIFFQSAKSA